MGEGVVAGELQAGSEAVGAGGVEGGYWDVMHDVLGRAEAFSSESSSVLKMRCT